MLVEIQIGNAYAKTSGEALRLAKDYYQYGRVTRVERNDHWSPMCHEWDEEKKAWVSNWWKVYGMNGVKN
jgi:hypothetical protein